MLRLVVSTAVQHEPAHSPGFRVILPAIFYEDRDARRRNCIEQDAHGLFPHRLKFSWAPGSAHINCRLLVLSWGVKFATASSRVVKNDFLLRISIVCLQRRWRRRKNPQRIAQDTSAVFSSSPPRFVKTLKMLTTEPFFTTLLGTTHYLLDALPSPYLALSRHVPLINR